MTASIPRCIVVGVDGSEGSSRATAVAERLAVDLNAEVVVAHGGRSSAGDPPTREQLARWCQPFTDAGVRMRIVVEDDDAARRLQRLASMYDAYLIVVGSTGRSELREFILGSVAVELAHHGNRPLVIVPTADSEIATP